MCVYIYNHFGVTVERRMDKLLHMARQTLCHGEASKSRAHLSAVDVAIEIPMVYRGFLKVHPKMKWMKWMKWMGTGGATHFRKPEICG